MKIIDIQKIDHLFISDNFEITFDDGEGYDGLKIIMSENDMWQIAHYCHDKISFKAQLKNKI